MHGYRVWLLLGQIRSSDIVDGTSMPKQPNLEMLCTFSHTRKWTWDRDPRGVWGVRLKDKL
jgi:hypothetical protein